MLTSSSSSSSLSIGSPPAFAWWSATKNITSLGVTFLSGTEVPILSSLRTTFASFIPSFVCLNLAPIYLNSFGTRGNLWQPTQLWTKTDNSHIDNVRCVCYCRVTSLNKLVCDVAYG